MKRLGLALSLVILAVVCSQAAPQSSYGEIEILRDTWGIPHVFSDTDPGAMYGLGYATAEERGFQMTYGLRIIQGRLAEVIGDRTKPGRRDTSVEHDRKMRTFGWARAAARTVPNLDRETRELLEAYSQGVNDSFAAQKAAGTLHPLFARLGVSAEPWKPEDCLLSWWHLSQFFATDGTRDLMAWHNRTSPRPGQRQPPAESRSWADDAVAVVQREDVPEAWVKRVEEFVTSRDLKGAGPGADTPKFSHAWVVGGAKTTTGASVLVSDPQTPVRDPGLWMEFHVSGRTFNIRGIGVPGSPGLLLGFNRGMAWGLTALGADQADLFRLETSDSHPDAYRWNGRWRKMDVRTEEIKIKGGTSETITIRETHLGPVVSAFCYPQANDPEVALKRIPLCETDRDTIQALFRIMRAQDAAEFARACGGWRFPSANCVYGDSKGRIGYTVLGAIPVRGRSAHDRDGGEAMPGTSDADDWRGFVPADLLPQVSDPKAGFLLSANHRPIAAFYGIPMGTSTGSMGDTIRSWRLRERLQGKSRFTPEDVLDVHYDAVNPARREIVRLGLHLRDTRQGQLSDETLRALEVLEKWLAAGASSDLTMAGAELATRIGTFFRIVATPLAAKYGGGESGLARFLKEAAAQIKADPKAAFEEDACRFIDSVLSQAWSAGGSAAGRPGQREAARSAASSKRLGWFESLDGFASLDPSQDIQSPELNCLDGQTIRSQAGQSYTQWVPLHNADAAQTICPVGHSDRPDSPLRTSTRSLWAEGKLHPAPLSRKAIEKLGAKRLRLDTSERNGPLPSNGP